MWNNGNFNSKQHFRCASCVIIFGLVLLTFSSYVLSSGEIWKAITGGNTSPRLLSSWGLNKTLIQQEKLQFIPECDCERRFFYRPPKNPTKMLDSTCSDEGSFYARGQKVVSFSLCIKDPNDTKRIQLYREGIAINLQKMKEYYPGSTMRLYTDINLEPGSDYCKLICSNPELHWCGVWNTPSLGDQSDMFLMTWRFLPLGDPTVDIFLSRDLDSAIQQREATAAHEWLHNSSKAFHFMRDHPDHDFPVLGALWGANNSRIGMKEGEALREKIIKLAKGPPKRKGRDQGIVARVIFYPKAKDIVAFDSYSCKRWRRYTEVRPFPVQRKDRHNDFAAANERSWYDLPKCPVECRPEYGKDWEYC